jgi:membrane protein
MVAVPARLIGLVRGLVEPLIRVNVVDRSLALGAQAFGAVIPLLIVLEAAQPGDRSLADDLIDRFHLHGAAADSVRQAFAVTTTQPTGTSALSSLVLVVAALSFTRRLQRLYEETWALPPRGIRGTGWGLVWLGFLGVWVALHPLLDDVVHGRTGVITSLAGAFAIGVLTPYLLLGRRLAWRALIFQGALTAAFTIALGIWTVIYMPRAIASSAGQYGAIGVAFALLTWLWGLGFVLVCSAVYGSLRRTRSGPQPAAVPAR